MYIKGNKYFADWRDVDGRRRRKSFPTKLGAERHESKMAASRPRVGESSQTNSPLSLRSVEQEEAAGPGGKRPGALSKNVAVSGSTNSASVTSALSKRSGQNSRRQAVALLTTRSGASLRRSRTPAHPTSAARFPSPQPRKPGKSSQPKPN